MSTRLLSFSVLLLLIYSGSAYANDKQIFVSLGTSYWNNFTEQLEAEIGRDFSGGPAAKNYLGAGVRLSDRWSIDMKYDPIPSAEFFLAGPTDDTIIYTLTDGFSVQLSAEHSIPINQKHGVHFFVRGGITHLKQSAEGTIRSNTSSRTIRHVTATSHVEETKPHIALGVRMPVWKQLDTGFLFTRVFSDDEALRTSFSTLLSWRF